MFKDDTTTISSLYGLAGVAENIKVTTAHTALKDSCYLLGVVSTISVAGLERHPANKLTRTKITRFCIVKMFTTFQASLLDEFKVTDHSNEVFKNNLEPEASRAQ